MTAPVDYKAEVDVADWADKTVEIVHLKLSTYECNLGSEWEWVGVSGSELWDSTEQEGDQIRLN